jgi:hypothetical protein
MPDNINTKIRAQRCSPAHRKIPRVAGAISGQLTMPNHSLHDAGSYDTDKAILAALINIPQSGAEFYTVVGEANTVAMVLLAPGGGLSSYHRRLAQAHPIISGTVRAEAEIGRPAPSPGVFHKSTLGWMLKNASHVAIWSGVFPQFAEDITRWGIEATNNGARFLLTIETAREKAAEWAALARRWKRPGTALTFFGPASVEVAQ